MSVCIWMNESGLRQWSGLDPGTWLSYCRDLELDLVPWPRAKSRGHWVTAELRIKHKNTKISSIFYNICPRLNISKSTWFSERHGKPNSNRPGSLWHGRGFGKAAGSMTGFIWKRGNWEKKGRDLAVFRSQSRLPFIPKKKSVILLMIM